VIPAVSFIPPNLPNDSTLEARCRAYTNRRGYRFLTVTRDWDEVEWLLGTGRARVVVFANPAHIERPVPAEIAAGISAEVTGRITRSTRVPGHQTVVKAIGCCPLPVRPGPGRAVILVPPGQLDPHGGRCAQLAEQQGLEITGVVQTLDAAIKLLHDREATVLLVADEDHMRDPDGLRIEIVSLQPTVAGARRSKLIRRRQ
jgi:hypothetical protein